MSQETLVPDDAAQDMLKETHFTFLSLNAMEIAMQLTVNDYRVFQDIEPTEYIDNLIGRVSAYGTIQLHKFEQVLVFTCCNSIGFLNCAFTNHVMFLKLHKTDHILIVSLILSAAIHYRALL